MLSITLCDLRFRVRQFVIAVVGAGIVFAMTLLLTGLADGFAAEIHQTIAGMRADAWVASEGATGQIGDLPPVPSTALSPVAHEPGVHGADPLVVIQASATSAGTVHNITIFGHRIGALGSQQVAAGRDVRHTGEAVVDAGSGMSVGDRFAVAGARFVVVGVVAGRTLFGGVPSVYIPLADAQSIAFGGQDRINAILTRGVPKSPPQGLKVLSNSDIERASLAAMGSALSSLKNARVVMWFIAVIIVAALVYISALERSRDFAVLKALGYSTQWIFSGLALQAVIVAVSAALLGAVVSNLMTGLFDQPVAIPGLAFIVVPFSAIAVGLVASLAALKRATSADPAQALAGA